MLNAVQIVLSIMIMLSIGCLLAHKGWVDERTSGIFSKILMVVALPGLMISNIIGSFDRQKFLDSGIGILVAFFTILVSYGIGITVSKLLKINDGRRGTFQVMFAFSNTMFIGLPVNLALFGDAGLPFTLMYYLANTVLFWTIGVYGIRKDSKALGDAGAALESMFAWKNLRKVFSPPLVTFFIAVALIMLNIKLPAFLMDVSKYMANLSTPMSMLFIGAVIYSIGIKGIRFDRDMIVLLIGRFIITPLIVILFFHFFNLPVLMKKVFVIQSAMPIITQSAVTTKAYGGDYKYASASITVSTVVGLAFIPLYMYILG